MAEIVLISVGSLKETYWKDALSEYKKRLLQYAKVDEINIKEETIRNEDDKSEISRALAAEGEKILAAIPKGAYKIALCVEGREYDSISLASAVESALDKGGRIALIIGSSHGLCDEVKRNADLKLSLSRLTFPHQLMRPLLLEVIYRSFTIIHGKKYHK